MIPNSVPTCRRYDLPEYYTVVYMTWREMMFGKLLQPNFIILAICLKMPVLQNLYWNQVFEWHISWITTHISCCTNFSEQPNNICWKSNNTGLILGTEIKVDFLTIFNWLSIYLKVLNIYWQKKVSTFFSSGNGQNPLAFSQSIA